MSFLTPMGSISSYDVDTDNIINICKKNKYIK